MENQHLIPGVCIIRSIGGVGDVLNTRLLLKAAHDKYGYVTYATKPCFFGLLEDSQWIDSLVDCRTIDRDSFKKVVDISNQCGTHETEFKNRMKQRTDILPELFPFHIRQYLFSMTKQRADVWAELFPIQLHQPTMHLSLDSDAYQRAFKRWDRLDRPDVALCPWTAERAKDISCVQKHIDYLMEAGFNPVILHDKDVEGFDVQSFDDYKEWVSFMRLMKGAIAADTSHLHLAGGLDIPTVAVYSYTSEIINKYYDSVIAYRSSLCSGCWDPVRCVYKPLKFARMKIKLCQFDVQPRRVVDLLVQMLSGKQAKSFGSCKTKSGFETTEMVTE